MSNAPIIAVVGATGAQGGGLAKAILNDPEKRFRLRALTRNPESDRARALAAAGAQVVAADADRPDSLRDALAGAHGAFVVTNYWEHMSPSREIAQATAWAKATGEAGVKHVVWSTLEDTRLDVPIEDPRLPILQDRYTVPHFDAKSEADSVFAAEAGPTTYLMAAFYWDNFIHFGAGPRPGEDGELVLALPLGDQKLPGIAASDIGAAALGVFREGEATIGRRIGIAGEILSGDEMAQKLGKALGRSVKFWNVPFDVYRGFGFPGADDMGNMFEWQAILGSRFLEARDVEATRALHPGLLSFDAWLARHAGEIPLG